MNSTSDLPEQISELCWLVYELAHELETLATTPYPQVHHFLMQNLTRRITQVAYATGEHLAHLPSTPLARCDMQSIEQLA